MKEAMLILMVVAAMVLGLSPQYGETVVPKGTHTLSADVVRDPETGLPLENLIKGSVAHALPRGDRLQ